jgi:hypothetical protein
MPHRNLGLFAALVVFAAIVATSASAHTGGRTLASIEPVLVEDSDLKALSTTEGGATVLPTTRTIPHWFGQATNPHNGVTYGYNMVGSNPFTCGGAACSTTVETDITPIIVRVGGLTFDGTSVVGATLASPQFAGNDYGTTSGATDSAFKRGPGGVLSQGDAGIPLQLQDATQRAQFNKVGRSNYHLLLHANVLPPVTIDVPANHGTLLQSGRGVVFADVDISWWSSKMKNLETKSDPTHLALYLTDDVLLYRFKEPLACCTIGYHGTKATGNGGGSANSSGNAPVQTFAWASYISPGIFTRPNGGLNWAFQDIHAISHEIAEWADDPFVNNYVEPWSTPTAPQYGCTNVLETGDPVVAIGFSMGTNTFRQGPTPDGTVSTDRTYHPEDEALLGWFMRSAPNTVAEPTQSPSANIGRYTLMGDLNPFPGFRGPATGC